MYPAAAIRVAEYRFQEFYAEAARERQAIEAERAQQPGSPTRRPSFTGFVAAFVAFLATTGSIAGGH